MNYELPARQALPVRHGGVSGGPGEAGGRIMGIRKKLFLAMFLFFILNSLFLIPVFAKTEFLTSWKAGSYVPYFYQGKALPAPNSTVTASFELIGDNNYPVDISGRLVRWYIDNTLYQSGVNLKTISFKINPLKRNDAQIRISLPKYNNGKDLDKLIAIPVANPEVIIDAPYRNHLISGGVNLLRGILYFFNIKDLRQTNFTWTANGQKTIASANAPDILELQVPDNAPGNSINVRLNVKNTENELEFAETSINLTIK